MAAPYPSFSSHLRTLQYAAAQALVSNPWRLSYYRPDRLTMPLSDTIILRSSSTLSLCSPYIRISSNFFQAVANKIPFFFLFLAMLACSWRVSRIAHFVALTLFGESITRKVRIPIKRFWWCACIISGSHSVRHKGSPDLGFWHSQTWDSFLLNTSIVQSLARKYFVLLLVLAVQEACILLCYATRPRQDTRRAKAYCGNLRFFEGDVSSLVTKWGINSWR